MNITLFDAHCHLGLDATDGLTTSGRILCAAQADDWPRIRDVAAHWPGTIPAYGLHPWHVDDASAGWHEALAGFLDADPIAWLGEAGLDNARRDAPSLTRQVDALARQLDLAAQRRRPVNLHCVKAWDQLLDCLDRRYLTNGPGRFIVHAFNGPHQYIAPLSSRGAWFTVGPLFWRRNSARAARRAAALPVDRLLLESDAFLSPGTDDVPALRRSVEWLADLHGCPTEAMASRIGDNVRRMTTHA